MKISVTKTLKSRIAGLVIDDIPIPTKRVNILRNNVIISNEIYPSTYHSVCHHFQDTMEG